MKPDKTTAQRNTRTVRTSSVIIFWLLLILTFAMSWLVSLTFVGESAFMNAYARVSIERYWLHEFSDVRGVKGYAETLLETDAALLREETRKALTPPFYPFIILLPMAALLFTAVGAVRQRTPTQFQHWVLVCSMLFVIGCVIAIYCRVKD